MDFHKYQVGIILINYNTSSDTIKCVESIYKKTRTVKDFKIIVVDNGSIYSDFLKLNELEKYERIEIVRSRLNLGFSAGNMFGVQFVRAKYFFFLNNDCELMNDCVSILYDFCEKHNNVGLCSPQMYSGDGNRIGSFDYLPRISTRYFGTGILRLFKGKEYRPRKSIYTKPIKVEVLSGSQLFVDSRFFNDSGGFDINLFLYCEEEDIAFKARNLGFDSYLVPDARNKHYCGKSTKDDFTIKREFYVSYFYLCRKYYSGAAVLLFKFYFILRLLKKSVKDIDSLRLAYFVTLGAPMKHSLRNKQVIFDK